MKDWKEYHDDEQQHADTQIVSLLRDSNRWMRVQRVDAANKKCVSKVPSQRVLEDCDEK